MANQWGYLIEKMQQRLTLLEQLIDRDRGGGLTTHLAEWRETKYWKEAIERGEFDVVHHRVSK